MDNTPKRRRLSPAVVISLLALVVALTATPAATVAARLITGKQIAKNAITSPKIKNGTVRVKDLAGGTRSHAYFKDRGGNFQLSTDANAKTTLSSVSLPKGSFVLIGSSGLTNISGETRSAYCFVEVDGTTLGTNRALDIASQRSTDATVTGIVKITSPTDALYACYASAANVWVPAGSRPSLTAIRVHGLTNQS